jgi:hypothetical protein
MTLGQAGLDGRLALQQLVQRGVEFVVIDRAKTELLAEAGGGGGGREGTRGGELGDRIKERACKPVGFVPTCVGFRLTERG